MIKKILTLLLALLMLSSIIHIFAGKNKLTYDGLDVNDDLFIFDLSDRVSEYAKIDNTTQSVKRLESLPEQWRYLEPLIFYYNQVNNGGHHQYFVNSEGLYRFLVLEGLRYFQIYELEKNYQEALEIYVVRGSKMSEVDTWEEFQQGYEEELYDQNDKSFYAIKPDLADRLQKYVIDHIEEYK